MCAFFWDQPKLFLFSVVGCITEGALGFCCSPGSAGCRRVGVGYCIALEQTTGSQDCWILLMTATEHEPVVLLVKSVRVLLMRAGLGPFFGNTTHLFLCLTLPTVKMSTLLPICLRDCLFWSLINGCKALDNLRQQILCNCNVQLLIASCQGYRLSGMLRQKWQEGGCGGWHCCLASKNLLMQAIHLTDFVMGLIQLSGCTSGFPLIELREESGQQVEMKWTVRNKKMID